MPEKTTSSILTGILVFLGFFLLSLGLQWSSGAWQSDFGAHADEGAHVVTSLMVRDYLAGGWKEQWHPMRYAEAYYEQFPKVAIGHYPPGFYLAAAVPLLLSRTPEALLVFMALLSAGVAWLTMRLGRKVFSSANSAILTGVLVCLLPLVRTYTAIVMADLLLVVFISLAVLAFGRFLIDGKARDSLLFGLFSAFAILTKGSGLCLALVPPLAIVFLRKWEVIRGYRLWLAPLPVLILALPWMLFTREITQEGMQEMGISTYMKTALPYYGERLVYEMGWIAVLCVFVAPVGLILRKEKNGESKNLWFCLLFALSISVAVLILVIPTGLDGRYLLTAIPCLLIAGAWFCEKIAGKLFPRIGVAGVILYVLASLIVIERPVVKQYTGAQVTLELIPPSSKPGENLRILVVTSARGEGAITAGAAFQRKSDVSIVRGSKALSKSDWLGRGYEIAFQDATEFREITDEERLDYLILDLPREGETVPEHWAKTLEVMKNLEKEGSGTLVGSVPSLRKGGLESRFFLYRFRQ